MDESEIARDFFSDGEPEKPTKPDGEIALFNRLLTLPASSAEWLDALDEISVPMMERLVEIYREQSRRTGAIKILERRISKRRKDVPKPEPTSAPANGTAVHGKTEPEVAAKPWFPAHWKEVQEAVKDVTRPVCYMCKPVYDALVENSGISDDRFSPDENDVCKKSNVVWHWNACFAPRYPNLNLRLGG